MYEIVDVEAELTYNKTHQHLDEKCNCCWCGSEFPSGFDLFMFNYTICKACVARSAQPVSWPLWQKHNCDRCHKPALSFKGDKPIVGEPWYLCKECLTEAAKYYRCYQPDNSHLTLMEKYKAFLSS